MITRTQKIFSLIRESGTRRDMDGNVCRGLTPGEISVVLALDSLHSTRNLLCHMERRGLVGVAGRASAVSPCRPQQIYTATVDSYPEVIRRTNVNVDYNRSAPSRNKTYRKLRKAGISAAEAAAAAGVVVRVR